MFAALPDLPRAQIEEGEKPDFVILVSGVRIEQAQLAADAPANEIADDHDRLQGLGQYRLAGFRSRDLVPE